MKPNIYTLFEIHKMDKTHLVTRNNNILDKWKCERCGLTVEIGFGWYKSKASDIRLNKNKKIK
jgi:hypothetical protein